MMKLGTEFEVDNREYVITKFLEEPNTGLAIIKEKDPPMYSFAVPVSLIKGILELIESTEDQESYCDDCVFPHKIIEDQ